MLTRFADIGAVITGVFGLLVLLLLLGAGTWWVTSRVLPRDVTSQISYVIAEKIGLNPYFSPTADEADSDISTEEVTGTNSFQSSIVGWLMLCDKDNAQQYNELKQLRAAAGQAALLTTAAGGATTRKTVNDTATDPTLPPQDGDDAPQRLPHEFSIEYDGQVGLSRGDFRSIPPVFLRVMSLSSDVAHDRRYYSQVQNKSYNLLTITTIFTIVIGLCTTILVSMSATDIFKNRPRVTFFIRILSIVFPAIGTAAAAVIAFLGPNDKYIRAGQTLAGLQQIHRQITNEVLKTDCAHPENVSAKLDSLAEQYANLLNGPASKENGAQGGGQGASGQTTTPANANTNANANATVSATTSGEAPSNAVPPAPALRLQLPSRPPPVQ